MQKSNSPRAGVLVSLSPLTSSFNKYVDLFSKAISDQGYAVGEFRWRPTVLRKSNVVIIHWPHQFFAPIRKLAIISPILQLAVIRLSKNLWGTRFVWVAHNAASHDTDKSVLPLARWFICSLDGIIYLSAYSRELIGALYPQSKTRVSLVTVHGHYRDVAVTPPTRARSIAGNVKLAYVGLIRPYKNLELLVDVTAKESGLELRVSGMSMDRALADRLLASARQAPHITFDLWDAPISDEKFEALVDSADAIVLPYRSVLNSGALLFALSRNRPVLAPNIGSLPELREVVGSDWIYLYEDFSRIVLRDFIGWLRKTKRNDMAPLDYYSWSRIGRELGEFIDSLRSKAIVKAHATEAPQKRNPVSPGN
jgi:glycosyltransferase involved in cell wall biosynthesis